MKRYILFGILLLSLTACSKELEPPATNPAVEETTTAAETTTVAETTTIAETTTVEETTTAPEIIVATPIVPTSAASTGWHAGSTEPVCLTFKDPESALVLNEGTPDLIVGVEAHCAKRSNVGTLQFIGDILKYFSYQVNNREILVTNWTDSETSWTADFMLQGLAYDYDSTADPSITVREEVTCPLCKEMYQKFLDGELH